MTGVCLLNRPPQSHLGWVDSNMDRGAISLLPLNALNVYYKLLTVHLHHLANLLALVVTTHNLKSQNRGFFFFKI